MRVTDSMMFDLALRDGGSARARVEAATAETTSGQKLVHPGDDPAGAGLVTVDRGVAARLDAIGQVAGRASDELQAADNALGDVSNLLVRAREIAMQLSSSGYDASQRAGGATEVRGLIASAVAALNTKVGNRYIFAGRADGTAPFDATGNYLGDAGVRQVELAPGVLQDASVRADVALTGAGGGTNVLATLTALANALDANDPAAAAATLDGLDAGTSQVSLARTQAGTAQGAFDAAVSASKTAADAARARVSSVADADAVDAAGRLALAQRALEASLTATASDFKLTILNYLGTSG
jgi:flagellar hook-associated protein 3 FlgL